MIPARPLRKGCGLLTLGLMVAGCGAPIDDLPREAVHGKVTLDGEPLAKGAIRFQTATPGATRAIEIGDLIRDGEYSIPADRGPVPGAYRVTITEEAAASPMEGGAPGPRPKVAPSRMPASAGMQTAEVKEGQSESIDFALKSQPETPAQAGRSGPRRVGPGRRVR